MAVSLSKPFVLWALIGMASCVATAKPSLELRVELKPNAAAYELKDRVTVVVSVKNASQEPIAFWNAFWWEPEGTVSWYVVDEAGKRVRNPHFHFDFFDRRGDPELVVLLPGDEVRSLAYFNISSFVFSNGNYELFVEYLAPKAEAETSEHVWDRESGTLVGSAKFRVVKTEENTRCFRCHPSVDLRR